MFIQSYSLKHLPVFESYFGEPSLLNGTKDRFLIEKENFTTTFFNPTSHTYVHHVSVFPKLNKMDLLYGLRLPVTVVDSVKFTFVSKSSQEEISFSRQEILNNTMLIPCSNETRKNGIKFEYLFCPFINPFPIGLFQRVDIEIQSQTWDTVFFLPVGVSLSNEHRAQLKNTKNIDVIIDSEPDPSIRSKLNYFHFQAQPSHDITKFAINYIEPFMYHKIEKINTIRQTHHQYNF